MILPWKRSTPQGWMCVTTALWLCWYRSATALQHIDAWSEAELPLMLRCSWPVGMNEIQYPKLLPSEMK